MKSKLCQAKAGAMAALGYGVAVSLIVGCLSMLSGCSKFLGQSKKEKNEISHGENSGQGAGGLAEELNLRIVVASADDPDLPDHAANLLTPRKPNSEENVVIAQDDELDFPTPIALPNDKQPKGRFMVWSEIWRGSRIVSASMDQRIEEEDGKLVGPTERIDVHYEAASRRWFFPLSALVRGAPGEENPGKQHRLTLDLTLEGGKRVLVRIRLRFRSQRLVLLHEGLELQSHWHFPRSADELRGLEHEGVLVGTTQLSNPVSRPIRAWIRGNNIVSMTTVLNRDYYRDFDRNAPMPYNWKIPALPPVHAQQWFRSDSRIGIVPLRFEGSGGVLLAPSLSSGGWTSVRLAPKEKVTVSWFARPLSGSRCVLPAAKRVTFEYSNGKQVPHNMTRFSDYPSTSGKSEFTTTCVREDIWTVAGLHFEGLGSILTAATEPLESLESHDSIDVIQPQVQAMSISEGNGAASANVPPYGCQGWF